MFLFHLTQWRLWGGFASPESAFSGAAEAVPPPHRKKKRDWKACSPSNLPNSLHLRKLSSYSFGILPATSAKHQKDMLLKAIGNSVADTAAGVAISSLYNLLSDVIMHCVITESFNRRVICTSSSV